MPLPQLTDPHDRITSSASPRVELVAQKVQTAPPVVDDGGWRAAKD
jgi:hypothetical protein